MIFFAYSRSAIVNMNTDYVCCELCLHFSSSSGFCFLFSFMVFVNLVYVRIWVGPPFVRRRVILTESSICLSKEVQIKNLGIVVQTEN